MQIQSMRTSTMLYKLRAFEEYSPLEIYACYVECVVAVLDVVLKEQTQRLVM